MMMRMISLVRLTWPPVLLSRFSIMFAMPVTIFENCAVKNVVIAAKSADGVGQIVGSGFFNADVAEAMGAPFDQPTVYELIDCITE